MQFLPPASTYPPGPNILLSILFQTLSNLLIETFLGMKVSATLVDETVFDCSVNLAITMNLLGSDDQGR
jgi:hypothetical protein